MMMRLWLLWNFTIAQTKWSNVFKIISNEEVSVFNGIGLFGIGDAERVCGV